MTTVLQPWVCDLTWKQQTVLICAIRGPDAGGSLAVKSIVRWLRRAILQNAAPHKTFMRQEIRLPDFSALAEDNPLVLDMLPVHYFGHLLHAFEVIWYDCPHIELADAASRAYFQLCEFLHVNVEPRRQYETRLADELDEL